MKSSRKKFTIVGNWKMNVDTFEEARALFAQALKAAKGSPKVAVVLAPSFPFIQGLARVKQDRIHLSAQDVSLESRGAFTGATSASQVKSAGADYTIIGHSERRAAGDTDEAISRKVLQATDANLRIILCVGEKERDNQAHYLRTIREQVLTAISKIDKKKIHWITIAYEPVWAIGKSFSTALKPSDIHEMSIYIKKVVAEALDKKDALKMSVLYGGSVNFENAQAILSDGAIDGLLIGRQSLDMEAFKNILDYANNL
jgi:triosephosphate isomerase